MRRRLAVALLLAAACAVVGPAGALAGGNDFAVKGAKKKAGPYKSDFLPVSVTEPRNLFVKVVSKDDDPQLVRLYENTGGIGAEDFGVKWFKGDKDVSHDVQTTGHEFTLKPSKSKLFRMRVKPEVPDPGNMCLYPGVDGGSGQKNVYFGVNGNLCN